MALNITTAVIGSGCNAATASPSLAQWDRGQILQISGVELPETYKVEFSNGDTLEAIPAIGTAEGVEIPDKLLYSSSPIRAYIVLSEAEGERNTEYWVTIYVKPREIPEDIEPTPAQQDVIDDLIAQLNTGVENAEAAADEAEAASQAVQDLGVRAETAASGAPAAVQKIVDAETGAVTLVFFLPQGEAGVSPVVTVTAITGGHRVTVTDAEGAHAFDVMDGEAGRSVTGVTMGADYKLTFTFSDGTTWTTPTSIRGETGATPRLTIGTVQTLEPGQSATAEITGTPEDPVLNLGIPQGQPGATDAGGVSYDDSETYQSGTVGAELSDLSRQISDLDDAVTDETTGLDTKAPVILETASGAIASFDDGADSMPIKKLVANIEPVQAGTGDPSPDNIRPISGWTGAEIHRTGKNLVDSTLAKIKAGNTPGTWSNNVYTYHDLTHTVNEDLTVTVTGTASGNDYFAIPFSGLNVGVNYILSGCPSGGSQSTFEIYIEGNRTETREQGNGKTITWSSSYGSIYLFVASGQTVDLTFKPMIRLASETDNTFEPYQGETISVNWEDAAGTVYGGALDVTNGVLTVTWAKSTITSFTRTNNYNFYHNTGSFAHRPLARLYNRSQLLCDRRPTITNPGSSTPADGCYIDPNRAVVVRTLTPYSTASAMVAAMGGQLEFCYLINPYTIQLDPAAMSTLLGTNNIWSSTGKTEVTYPADTKLYIEQLTKPTEDDMTADHAISAGTFFQLGNTLYLATAAIAAGATITPGTNATKLSLADALNTLNS